MKKLICLALLLCLSTVALAVPSKTTADLYSFTATAADGTEIYLRRVDPELELEEYPEIIEVGNDELFKLSAAEGIVDYFGDVADLDGEAVELTDLTVDEFFTMIADGAHEGCGDVTAILLVPTPYEVDEEVLVLIGFVADEEVTWTAYTGIGLEPEEGEVETTGRVQVVFDEETVLKIQNDYALAALLSK